MSQEKIIFEQTAPEKEVTNTAQTLAETLTQLTLLSSAVENQQTGLQEFFTHPFTQLDQVFQQLEKQFRTEYFGNGLKVELKNLNPVHFHQQAQAIITEVKATIPLKEQKNEIRKRLKKMFFDDLKYFVEEYVLRLRYSQTNYLISENGISSQSYLHTDIPTVCENFNQARQKDNGKISRPQIESLVFGDFLETWGKTAKVGDKTIVLSPPGSKSEGYPGRGKSHYSYLFVYHKDTPSNVKVHMIKVWVNMAESKDLLNQIQNQYGVTQPNYTKQIQNLKHRDALLLQPVFLDASASFEQIKTLLTKYDKNIPHRKRELKIPNVEKFWEDYAGFFDDFLSEEMLPIFENPELDQDGVEKIEGAFSFFQRLSLELIDVQKEFKKLSIPYEGEARQEKLTDMKERLKDIVDTFIRGKKGLLNREEKMAYHQNLLAIFSSSGGANAFRRIASVGSCLGGTPFSLAGQMLNPKLAQSLTLGKLTPVQLEQFKGNNFVCPLCGLGIKNQHICPKCGQVHGIPMCTFMSDLHNKGKNLLKGVKSAIKTPIRKKAPEPKHLIHSSGESEGLGAIFANNGPSQRLGDLLASKY